MTNERDDSNMTYQHVVEGSDLDPGEAQPGTGQNICMRCEGSGMTDGRTCPVCRGIGRVNDGMGSGTL